LEKVFLIESSFEPGPLSLPDPLPNSIPECHQLILQMHNRILELEKQKRRRDRTIHGPRSAQVDKDSLAGEGKEIYEQTCKSVDAEKNKRGQPSSPGHAGGGRNAPNYADDEETIRHEETDACKLDCPDCGVARKFFGFRVSYQLDYIPGKYKRIKHVEYSYRCAHCLGNIITKTKPLQPIDKGYPTARFLAHVINSKIRRHLPNYRQESEMKALNIPVDRSNLSRWQMQSADELQIIVDRMHELILESRVIESDETNLPFIRKGAGRTITGKLSIYRGDETRPYNLYNFTENGKAENHTKFLEGFKGHLLTDGTAVFNGVLANGAISANCWAHVERYFEDAKQAEEELADYALGIIKSIFKIESLVMTLPESERVALRQQHTKPLLDEFKIWLDAQSKIAAPTSLADAIAYTLNRWTALTQFLDQGFLKAHNNDSENGLRPAVLGRKNWLFAGSVRGGKATATLMSLVQTCLRLGIEPFEYLTDVLTRLPSTPTSSIDQFLPDQWKLLRAQPTKASTEQAS
jgi:transposase